VFGERYDYSISEPCRIKKIKCRKGGNDLPLGEGSRRGRNQSSLRYHVKITRLPQIGRGGELKSGETARVLIKKGTKDSSLSGRIAASHGYGGEELSFGSHKRGSSKSSNDLLPGRKAY